MLTFVNLHATKKAIFFNPKLYISVREIKRIKDMLDAVNFGTLTRTSKVVSNPISNSTPNFSNNNESIFANNRKDEREYRQAETVAYANPFAFLNNSDNSEVSAFAA